MLTRKVIYIAVWNWC